MNNFSFGCITVYLAAAAVARGETSSFEFTVAAGQHKRNHVPVRVEVPRDRIGKDRIASITLAGTDGKSVPAQWTGPGLTSAAGELHFILPHLAAGESVRLKATLSTEPPPSSAQGFTWHDQSGHHTELKFGERKILTYHYERLDESTPESRVRTYKVFHHVYSPSGDRIVTGGLNEDPKVHSPHHRGIFYGFNRITYGDGKTADTWHCIDGAFQQHERFLASEEGPVLGRHRVVISWHGKEAAFAEEERELTVYNVPGGHLMEFASRLKSLSGRVRIDGDPQHAGFQFRTHNDVDAFTSGETIFVRPDGTGNPGETRNWDPQTRQGLVNLPWNAMSFVLGGKRYTAAYLDHPGNPKEARFSEREYGRFGSYFEYTLEKDKPLTVNYRLWLQEGLMKPEEVARLSDNFVDPVKVTVHDTMLPPLVDLGPGQRYQGKEGGLYPGGSNVRPAAHDAAGQKIARSIVPLAADGSPDPVNGKIVIMPVSVSNAYGAWHRGDESNTSTTIMTRANANPAKNPKLFIAYGFEYQLDGGNTGTGDPGPDSLFYKSLDYALKEQEITPRQVQIVWLSMPVSGKSWKTNLPPEARSFPADAEQSKLAWKEIIRAIYVRYPNVRIIYSSTKGTMYMSASEKENSEWIGGPIEPFNHDAAWAVKWVIEDQIKGDPDLNYDPARGPVKAPWLSWGPYFWSYPDGTPRHYDGLIWTMADVGPDLLHPSLSGLTKYANLFLHQMATDSTATPWFLNPDAPPNKPPTIARAAAAAADPVSGPTTVLSVQGADDGGESNLTYTWSCSGPPGVTFSANGPNKAKNTTATFPGAGRYSFQVTIADTGGLTASSSVDVTVTR